ncbi:MAG TPA: S8 family serine peptidase, partial [Marinobacter sp.]|nr:S8 family serine peptidase [Marinobacter sp.]
MLVADTLGVCELDAVGKQDRGLGDGTALVILMMFVLTGCGGNSGSAELPISTNVALSGVIDIEAGTRVDKDNADALLYSRPAQSAQGLPAEFLLAGYVSGSEGEYPGDRGWAFNYFFDPVDRYTFPFRPGFEVSLQIFETRAGFTSDITLRLTDASGAPVTTETANRSGARVTISPENIAEGNYTISVESAGTAPMLYILSAQRTESSLARSFRWPEHDYVPGEAIVSLKNRAQTFGAPSSYTTRSMAQADRELAPGVWVFKQPATTSRLSAGKTADTLSWINTLSKDPSVDWASPNYRTHALNTPVSEPLYNSSVLGQQWHYSLINGPVAWQLAPGGGSGVKVAVMDTGLFYNRSTRAWHSDLNGNVGPGYDFVDGEQPEDPGNAVGGSVFHGTHVAGTIAAEVNGRGGAGIAFKSTLIPVRVLGEGGTGSLADLIEAMQWVVGTDQTAAKADIVNLSLGGLPCSGPAVRGKKGSLQSIIEYGAKTKNMLFVAAAGNSATSERSCPAGLDYVFSVSATDGAGRLASYSNFGATIDIAAPGGDASRSSSGSSQGDLISSTSAAVINGELTEVYLGLQGTSMAAPHFSGVLALMKAANPDLKYDDVRGFLNSGNLTASPCDFPCKRIDSLGFGLLDGGKAMQAVLSGSVPELITASPAVASLATEAGVAGDTFVVISPLGSHSAVIENIAASDLWFSATPETSLPSGVDTNETAIIKLTLNPEKMNPGISYRGRLDITYSTSTEASSVLTVPVIGQQITDRQARDAGRHFVLLVHPDPDPEGDVYTTVAQTTAVAVDGQYQFAFLPDDGVAPR